MQQLFLLKRSWQSIGVNVGLHAVFFISCVFLPLPRLLMVGGIVALLTSCCYQHHRQGRYTRLWKGTHWCLFTRTGKIMRAHLREDSVLTPFITLLRFDVIDPPQKTITHLVTLAPRDFYAIKRMTI